METTPLASQNGGFIGGNTGQAFVGGNSMTGTGSGMGMGNQGMMPTGMGSFGSMGGMGGMGGQFGGMRGMGQMGYGQNGMQNTNQVQMKMTKAHGYREYNYLECTS